MIEPAKVRCPRCGAPVLLAETHVRPDGSRFERYLCEVCLCVFDGPEVEKPG